MSYNSRVIIHFLVALGHSNTEIHNLIIKAYGKRAISIRTVERWASRFRAGENLIEDKPRVGRPKSDLILTSIQNLLNEQPFISAKIISKILKIPYTTILDKMKKEMGLKKYYFRWIPYNLDENLKNLRVSKAKEMLIILNNQKKFPWKNIITGDESWLLNFYPPKSQWSTEKPKISKKISNRFQKKIMISVFFSLSGFCSIVFLPKNQKFNSTFFLENVLSDIETKINLRRPKLGMKNLVLHMDNARPHKTIKVHKKLDDLGVIELPQPPYSPDISPCDFWLFGKLKEYLVNRSHESMEELKIDVENFLIKIKKKGD